MAGIIGNFGPWELILILASIPFLLGSVALYFVPTIIAFHKGHPQKKYIALINTLLGWTLLGWILVLIWALNTTETTELKQ